MKQIRACTILACLLLLPALGWTEPLANTAFTAPWVDWDRTSDRVVSAPNDAGAAYPRAKQLSNGEILLGYHHGGGLGDYGAGVTLRKSRDGGATWYQTQEIEAPEKRFWGFCNPDFIELGNSGHLMLVTAARGKSSPRTVNWFGSEGEHSGLRLRFSNDFGATWSPPRMVAAGIGRVWEPSVVRLPSGELQIFFANEAQDLEEEGASQAIESIRSLDDGQTWSGVTIVSEHAGCRNGMPSALVLNNGHVVCGQEVVGLATSPWITDTFQGRARDYHLAQDQYDFGAAPFLARAPDGSTLLAYHSQLLQPLGFKHLNMAWMFSQIFIQRGDAEAENFGPASCPWPAFSTLHNGAFFPSLLVMKNATLVCLASFITVHPDHTVSTVVHWIKGKLNAGAGTDPVGSKPSVARAIDPPPASLPGTEYRYGPPPDNQSKSAGTGD